ncbi:MAG TPA: hypothetical protein VHL11_17685, partial [Phototrophicaceae bacterium]|nr:hypothetical protein [Phototrophicaceae bacterium]
MKARFWLVLILLLLINNIIHSQSFPEFPLMPTPEQIFMDNVEVVSARFPPEYFYLSVANETRVIQYLSSDQSNPTPVAYPDNFKRINQYAYIGGQYYLEVHEILNGDQNSVRSWIWIFNPDNLTFTAYAPFCDRSSLRLDDLTEQPWVLLVEQETLKTHL